MNNKRTDGIHPRNKNTSIDPLTPLADISKSFGIEATADFMGIPLHQ